MNSTPIAVTFHPTQSLASPQQVHCSSVGVCVCVHACVCMRVRLCVPYVMSGSTCACVCMCTQTCTDQHDHLESRLGIHVFSNTRVYTQYIILKTLKTTLWSWLVIVSMGSVHHILILLNTTPIIQKDHYLLTSQITKSFTEIRDFSRKFVGTSLVETWLPWPTLGQRYVFGILLSRER